MPIVHRQPLALASVLVVVGAACAPLVGADFDSFHGQTDDATSPADGDDATAPEIADGSASSARDGTTATSPDGSPCSPTCAGKACGADDGCGRACQTGTCTGDLVCTGGACACDPKTCSGCCEGDRCVDGTATDACGKGGTRCGACADHYQCKSGACTPFDLACGDNTTGTTGNITCNQVCAGLGRTCNTGCYPAPFPTAAGRVSSTAHCANLGNYLGLCETVVPLPPGQSIECCCSA